jgi:phosphoribosylanthranilate isomerase
MALRIPVFISSVNNLSDARYCAGMGVRWLGFSTEDIGKRFSEADLRGMIDWVEGIETVLEIRGSSIEEESVEREAFDFVLLSPDSISEADKAVIQEIHIDQKTDLEEVIKKTPDCEFLLLTGPNELINAGEVKEQLKQIAAKSALILGFGIDNDSLDWIEKELKPAGIMLKGGDEIRPGYKDFDELADILEYLETDDF